MKDFLWAYLKYKTENKKIENFWPKPWTNPFGEIQILPPF